jgi:hypothetical protein
MASEIKVDTISEKTSAAGVTVDGVLLKDSKIGGTITIPGSTGTMALTSDISAGGLEEADQWALTANFTTSGDNDITSNLARPTGTLQSYIGTGMTQSSGVFTFPSTGYYLISVSAYIQATTSDGAVIETISTNDNFSSQDTISSVIIGGFNSGTKDNSTGFNETIVDITDTANDKIKFRAASITSGSIIIGSANQVQTAFNFKKLGDT